MMESNSSSQDEVDLYSLLKVDRSATEEEIHRAYKNLSTTFHPDKLPAITSTEDREKVQGVFLEFKRASKFFQCFPFLVAQSTAAQILQLAFCR